MHLPRMKRDIVNYENSTTYLNTYGTLYNWSAANNGYGSSDADPSGIRGMSVWLASAQ